ncbi:hypothetical protein HMPREF0765_4576 [Sphingobacterium spiritivorum ATCC 33300]|uniref:Uncharacterized protein n=1 Tax=Sphingobacterium spiritivorum ATCC 33300 TaxID=525372 RepID=C2G4S0_SPHSI|nr:hypothetical protein HMPREF0765_4576 [Sphingobacterium spiritivorum ATCC 33300]
MYYSGILTQKFYKTYINLYNMYLSGRDSLYYFLFLRVGR